MVRSNVCAYGCCCIYRRSRVRMAIAAAGVAVVAPLVLWGVQLALWKLLLTASAGHMQPRRAVIVGLTEQGVQLDEMFSSHPLLRIQSLGFFAEEHAENNDAARILGNVEAVPGICAPTSDPAGFTVPAMSRDPRLLKLLDALEPIGGRRYISCPTCWR